MGENTAQVTAGVRDSVAKSTEDVLDHHLQAFGAGDLNGILEDYTTDSVVIASDGAVLRGPEQMAPLFQAFIESLAGENGMRLQSMEAAKKNIDDTSHDLRKRAQQLRQDEITSELLDVISGAEALRPASEA